MKSLLQKLEDLWVAVTFAEAGEVEFAAKIAGKEPHEHVEAASATVKV